MPDVTGTAGLYERVSVKRLMADVEALARWVRLSGTPEELEAFHYVQRQLKAAGCKTTLIMHDAFISLPGPASLAVTPHGSSVPIAFSCVTHSFSASTGGEVINGPACFAGDGKPADLDCVRPGGKIAVVDGLATPDRVHAAGRAGAAGLVCLNRDPLVHEMIVSPVWGSPTRDDLDRLPTIPVVSVAAADADRLREMVKSGTLWLHLKTEVETRWRKTPVLIGDLPGGVEDTFVMLAGHIDSWHRGAMDNGTANATMLEVARVLGRVKRYRGVRFAFWSGHSHGRYSGSTWYVDHHWTELNDRCVAHVNIDSVGGRGAVINAHAYSMPETSGVADRVIRAVTGGRFIGGRVGRAGDQSFLGVGLPSLLMSLSEQTGDSPEASRDFNIRTGGATGGLGWWWHTTDDLPDKIDPEILHRDARIYVGIMHAFANEPIVPLDYAATARVWLKALRELPRGAAAHVDVKPVVAEARRLAGAAAVLGRTAATVARKPNRRAAHTVNAALMAMGRALIPVGYTGAGRFDHDPALEQHGTPLLTATRALGDAGGDEAKHLAVRAQRDLNAVRFALRQAADVAEVAVREVRHTGRGRR
jgi:hypothetical protein